MAIYSLWGSALSDICEDGDTLLELVSDINACLGLKKSGIPMKMFVCEIMWRWGYANNFDLPKKKKKGLELFTQSKRNQIKPKSH